MAGKVGKVMGEFKRRELRSGSKHGPVVRKRTQAIAIGLSEAREAGENVPPPPGVRRRGRSRAIAALRRR